MDRHAPNLDARLDLPRERLHGVGQSALSDAELLALVLRTGGGGEDALSVARQLLGSRGGLHGVAASAPDEIGRELGVGPAKAASVVAALELGRRIAGRRLVPGCSFAGPVEVHQHFWPQLRDCSQERFIVVLLDGRNRVRGEVLVSQGTLTASLVHPREVFRPAVRSAAASLVLVHNHPSGDPAPSAEDREVTRRLIRAGELIGIRILDHVVVAERGYFSFCEAGEIEERSPGVSTDPVGDR